MNRALCLALGLLAAPAVPAADPPTRPIPDLIRDLGAAEFDAREAAEAALGRAGPAAVAALRAAAQSPDPEVTFRAARALRAAEWALPADTPAGVADAVRRYRAAPEADRPARRAAALDAAARAGKGGLPALRLLADRLTRDQTDDTVSQVRGELQAAVRRAVPRLLLADREADAEALLEAALDLGPPQDSGADFAAFVLDRGTPAADLPRLERLRAADGPGARGAAWAVFTLHRAAGDFGKATEAIGWLSGRPPEPPVLTAPAPGNVGVSGAISADAGRWADIADRLPADAPPGERLTVLRLAGRTKDLAAAARTLQDAAAPKPDESPLPLVQTLLLAGRVDDADRAAAPGDWPSVRFRLAAGRLRFADALAVTGKPGLQAGNLKEWQAWQVERGKLLLRLGHLAEGRKCLAAVADPNQPEEVPGVPPELAEDVQAGRLDEAIAKAAGLLDKADDPNELAGRLCPLLLPGVLTADTVWAALRGGSHSTKPAGESFQAVARVVGGTARPGEYEAARADLRAVAGAGPADAATRRAAALQLALANRKDADAEAALRDDADAAGPDASPRPWLAWGKFLADRGRHRDAAGVYFRAWDRSPAAAAFLYQSGRALVAAGDAAGGGRRVAVAFRTPLGDENAWSDLADEVTADAPAADRTRAADGLGRAFAGAESAVVWDRRARAYRAAGNFSAAARAHDRLIYEVARAKNMSFAGDLWRYLRLPQMADLDRANAVLAAGRPADAAGLARAVLAGTPGDVSDAVRLVPRFDAAGARAEADELYRAVRDPLAAVVRDHPESAYYRNELAWLMANARRDLDTGLAHAEKAVALEPGNGSYVDTLAEVLFRRGDRVGAERLMKELVSKHPQRGYFGRQLARFRAGDVGSAPPEEAE